MVDLRPICFMHEQTYSQIKGLVEVVLQLEIGYILQIIGNKPIFCYYCRKKRRRFDQQAVFHFYFFYGAYPAIDQPTEYGFCPLLVIAWAIISEIG